MPPHRENLEVYAADYAEEMRVRWNGPDALVPHKRKRRARFCHDGCTGWHWLNALGVQHYFLEPDPNFDGEGFWEDERNPLPHAHLVAVRCVDNDGTNPYMRPIRGDKLLAWVDSKEGSIEHSDSGHIPTCDH